MSSSTSASRAAVCADVVGMATQTLRRFMAPVSPVDSHATTSTISMFQARLLSEAQGNPYYAPNSQFWPMILPKTTTPSCNIWDLHTFHQVVAMYPMQEATNAIQLSLGGDDAAFCRNPEQFGGARSSI